MTVAIQCRKMYSHVPVPMGNTTLSTTEKDLGVHVTRLPVNAKSIPFAVDRLTSFVLLVAITEGKVLRI